jgi:hypothetical protein
MVTAHNLMPWIVVAAALIAAVFRHLLFVRIGAVAVILLCALLASGALIAPHRIAEALVHRSPQSDEWQRGARDTRDAVYGTLPLLAASFLGLAVLALVPARGRHQPSNQAMQRTAPRSDA